ncbi:Phytanoyl-CoA dioxygenase (PhyH) [compost metagenome]
MNQEYKEKGYFVVRGLFDKNELVELKEVLLDFHESWKRKNSEFYSEKAVNSAYLTGSEHLSDARRDVLFQFIGSHKVMKALHSVVSERPSFMNTQLFFDPANEGQNNYWHRDPQYHLTIEEQKEALSGPNVVHFRIPLARERGMELVPGTHKRWDTNEELEIRLEKGSRRNHENLSTGVTVELDIGDLLVFSANMIHRGLYGMERLSLDILFCDPEPDLMKFVDDDCLPNQEAIRKISDPSAFLNTIVLKANNREMRATSA